MKKIVISIIVGSSLIILSTFDITFGCSCITVTPSNRFAGAKIVFAGRVIDAVKFQREIKELDMIMPYVSYTFLVTQRWRGPALDTLRIISHEQGSACGYNFKIDEDYVVYASTSKEDIVTGACQGNKPVSNAIWEQYKLPEPEYEREGYTFPRLTLSDIFDTLVEPDDASGYAIEALADLEDEREEVLEALHEVLTNQRPGDARLAALTLEIMGKEARPLVPDLARLLQKGTPYERVAAIRSLAAVTSPEAFFEYLMKGLSDSDAAVVKASLGNIWRNWRHFSQDNQNAVLEQIMIALHHENPYIRGVAASIVRDIDDDIGPIRSELERLAQQDPDRSVREIAKRMLRYLDGRTVESN